MTSIDIFCCVYYDSLIVTTINGLNRFIPIIVLIRIIQNNSVNQKIYNYNYIILNLLFTLLCL